MTTETQMPLARESAQALAARRDEPAWMREQRAAAWDLYESLPMPTLRDEEWRRTDIRAVRLNDLQLPAPNGHAPVPAHWLPAPDALTTRAGVLVQRDASPVHRSVTDALAGQGVILTDMDSALRTHGDLIRDHFMREAVRADYSKFAALHAALWSGGTFLYVPDGVEVALPLQSSLWLDEPGRGIFPHTLVILGRNSKATLIEETGSQGAHGTLNVPVVELLVGEGAHLTYITLQEFDDSPNQIGVHRAILERDATLSWMTATLGGRLAKLNLDTELRGPGANAEMLGMYFASGKELLDFHTLQDHQAPHAGSDLLFKGVLKDEARTVFSGLIRVHEGAQKTDAYQKNNNLILSPHARADSIPNLEIGANDVRCSHGATAGRVAEDQLFYLMSRGLTRRAAERLIVTGFLVPLIERVPLEDLRQRLYTLIDSKMG
jgi:Fe-S cluster assembly protein SufD